MTVHGFTQDPVAQCVKTVGELLTLILEIAADFKSVKLFLPLALSLPECVGMSISEHAYCPGSLESCFSRIREIFTPGAVSLNGHPLGLIESNDPRGCFCIGGDDYAVVEF
jgi:hypothetical protein